MSGASQTRVGLEHLREWRVWKGYSQQELAGVAKSTIIQLELARGTANFVTIGKLAKAFNISREQLLHESPEPTLSQSNT